MLRSGAVTWLWRMLLGSVLMPGLGCSLLFETTSADATKPASDSGANAPDGSVPCPIVVEEQFESTTGLSLAGAADCQSSIESNQLVLTGNTGGCVLRHPTPIGFGPASKVTIELGEGDPAAGFSLVWQNTSYRIHHDADDNKTRIRVKKGSDAESILANGPLTDKLWQLERHGNEIVFSSGPNESSSLTPYDTPYTLDDSDDLSELTVALESRDNTPRTIKFKSFVVEACPSL